MQSRLIVRNFGPIEFVDLDLRNVNVFIGPQASGKSALAKIYTILKAPRKFFKWNIVLEGASQGHMYFEGVLEEYNISSFLRADTEIEFQSELHNISYRDGMINYEPLLLKRIEQLEQYKTDFQENQKAILYEVKNLVEKFIWFNFRVHDILDIDFESTASFLTILDTITLTESQFHRIVEIIKEIEANLSTNAAVYIPAERNFINIIKNSSLNLLLNNVPIPKHILAFGAEVEKSSIKNIDLGFLQKNLIYKDVNGEARIFTDDNHSIKLTEAASGIQSVLPVLIPILSHKASAGHRSFVIEEPELNLFPIAQYELIKKLESSRKEPYWEDYGTIHTYTTHSPYILSALNNLLYANKVKRNHIESDEFMSNSNLESEVNKIVSAEINPYYFTAYQICNGQAESIFDRETGLIRENYIDSASDKLADDFDALMDLAQ
ncbi:AAA family ATPase [Chitinophaga sp. sic0106]|uniref:AAA family ATPase n=1 Tax=Chitinophaga sp. sic0106 TaxID=2854785 RepID=UPI001C48B4A5|nr:AAA family ATPase [Chitinophaga sp. sic0106]MBV7529691.1 ATP-binding protein [Chitinophaga sp. sic0106]